MPILTLIIEKSSDIKSILIIILIFMKLMA